MNRKLILKIVAFIVLTILVCISSLMFLLGFLGEDALLAFGGFAIYVICGIGFERAIKIGG